MAGLLGIVPLRGLKESPSGPDLFQRMMDGVAAQTGADTVEAWYLPSCGARLARAGRKIHRLESLAPSGTPEGGFRLFVAKPTGHQQAAPDPDAAFLSFEWEPGNNRVTITADKTASFPLFYAVCDGNLLFAPTVAAVSSLCGPDQIDATALTQLLVHGHLLGDATLDVRGRRLRGGETLRVQNGEVFSSFWWRFHPGSPEAGLAASDELERLIDESVAGDLGSGDESVIFLSGGADSRAILGAAMRVADKSAGPLRTVSWSVGGTDSTSDASIAGRIANDFGLRHTVLVRQWADPSALVRRAVIATDALSEMGCFHACEIPMMEELVCGGTVRVLRGDEVFGYHGAVRSPCEALGEVFIGLLDDCPAALALLRSRQAGQLRQANRQALENVISEIPSGSPGQLKDILYHSQRLQCYLNSAVTYKQQILDHRNPLLNGRILDFVQKIPDAQRVNKQFFLEAVRQAYPALWTYPLAGSSGLEDWIPMLRTPLWRAFLEDEFEEVRSPLWNYVHRPTARALLEGVLRGQIANASDMRAFARSRLRFSRFLSKLFNRNEESGGGVFNVRPERILMRLLALKIWFGRGTSAARSIGIPVQTWS